jgi:hypothetical protein
LSGVRSVGENGPGTISRIDPVTGQARVVDTLKYSPTVGLSISVDGEKMAYSGLISASSHLTLVEDFH